MTSPSIPARSVTDYVTLGRSGLRVSPFCLGTATFGEDQGWGATPAVSEQILARYLERGGNFIDSANVYTHGHAEKIIGDYFARVGGRDRAVISTKFFGNLYARDPNGGGAGRKSLVAACEQSLRRLQTDYIDLYWMHMWDPYTPIEETLRAMDDLVRAGKVRYLGFSDTPAWKTAQAQTIAQLRGWSALAGLQVEYSLLERTVETELVPMARELGLGVTAWGPLKGGMLTGKYTRENAATVKPDRGPLVTGNFNERGFAVVDALNAAARTLGATPAGVALAWLLARPGLTSLLVGARTLQQLDANLDAAAVTLSADIVAQLDAASEPPLNFVRHSEFVAGPCMHGGVSINGVTPIVFPLSAGPDTKIW
ncbi:MAG: aldo/keto reductase [Steroidobacteraceae bacterium]